jgi:hypothetical protein
MTTRSFRTWYGVVAGIAAWTVHLLAVSSLAREACLRAGTIWVMHAITAACAAATVVALVFAWQLARQPGEDESAFADGRERFLGRLGVLVSAINLLLILGEGSYVELVRRCG